MLVPVSMGMGRGEGELGWLIPWNMGLFGSGTMGIMTIIEPEKMPADPKPATARPIMKTTDVGAAAQMMEPTSNTTMTAM